jgi:RNA 2',3'-cyclic 3'-phosphodiesterase
VRLFVAIVPPDAVLAELDAAVAPLRESRPELRWARPPEWHLTLAFLGEVSEAVLPELAERLARAAARHPARELAVSGAGAFPRRSRATVLWAGVRSDADLAPLAASVAAAARRAGAGSAEEGRSYRPHLTLARCRQPADVADLTAALAGFAGTAWTAGEIVLVRSTLGRGRPQYDHLQSWPLRAATG